MLFGRVQFHDDEMNTVSCWWWNKRTYLLLEPRECSFDNGKTFTPQKNIVWAKIPGNHVIGGPFFIKDNLNGDILKSIRMNKC